MPAIVDTILQRGEFLTAYTPYQPEMSQGVLQAIFEYQTAICELTGMDVSNASGYDGFTVAADACFIAKHATGRTRIVLAETLNPQVREVVKTYAPGFGLEVVEVGARGRRHRPRAHRRRGRGRGGRDLPAAELLRLPRGRARARGRRARGGRARGRPRRPHLARRARGARRVRLRHGDRRGPGGRQRAELRRPALRLPRRAHRVHPPHARAGSSARRPTSNGDRGFVLTLQTREQHIRREKATSNMTTNQTLLALGGLVTLAWLGPQGLRELGETCMSLAGYARERIALPAGVRPARVQGARAAHAAARRAR